MEKDKALRRHLHELLVGSSAHIDVESALKDFPLGRINERIPGSPHTPWELLEHIRIAQWDILDFSTNAGYKEMKFPDDYWPKAEALDGGWTAH